MLDLSRDPEEVARALDRACEEIGFFYVANHGVAEELLRLVFAQSARFHAEPLEKKNALTINAFHRGYIGAPYYRRRGMEHGLGFWVFREGEGEQYEHTGAGLGFATIFRLYPDEHLAIALLANGTSLDREGIADRLYELFRD